MCACRERGSLMLLSHTYFQPDVLISFFLLQCLLGFSAWFHLHFLLYFKITHLFHSVLLKSPPSTQHHSSNPFLHQALGGTEVSREKKNLRVQSDAFSGTVKMEVFGSSTRYKLLERGILGCLHSMPLQHCLVSGACSADNLLLMLTSAFPIFSDMDYSVPSSHDAPLHSWSRSYPFILEFFA